MKKCMSASSKIINLEKAGRDFEEADLLSRLAAVVESSDDAIISKNLDGTIRTWNSGAEHIFGYKAEEIIGKSILTLIPPERRAEEIEIIAKLERGERIDHFETIRVRKDGTQIHVSLTCSPVKDKNGNIVGASKIARDITQKKHIEEEREALLVSERAARAEAERTSLMKDEFLATLSHELRSPLNGILGWAQLLRTRKGISNEAQEGLSIIERNTRIQARLIDDLLDMSRITSGKLRIDVQEIDLEDMVRSTLASVRHSAEAKEIELHSIIDPFPEPFRGDPNRLQQCLWNLLNNAIKFTPKGGKVQIALQRIDGHIVISVHDSGIGIDADFLPHVFDRFQQADASTTRRHGGLGIGLAIVKNLVELHGGKVTAKSEGKDLGSTFSIELPLIVAHIQSDKYKGGLSGADHLGPLALDHPSLKGIRVLALDDECDATTIIKQILEECGAQVMIASSVAEAVKMVESERPDLILSDIGMPDEDGYTFIKRVRALPPEKGGHTPAAAITAFARTEDRTKALRAGFQSHIAKPFEPIELTAVVASLTTR